MAEKQTDEMCHAERVLQFAAELVEVERAALNGGHDDGEGMAAKEAIFAATDIRDAPTYAQVALATGRSVRGVEEIRRVVLERCASAPDCSRRIGALVNATETRSYTLVHFLATRRNVIRSGCGSMVEANSIAAQVTLASTLEARGIAGGRERR